VIIRRKPEVESDYLNLGDVELYDTNGARIPQSYGGNRYSTAGMSSVYPGTTPLNCLDGNLQSMCSSGEGDSNAHLRIAYTCPGGSSKYLSQVVVRNRADCCQGRITRYLVEFFNASKMIDLPSYSFHDSQPTFTIPIPRGKDFQSL
jgi:hypothetical protein